MTVHIYIIKELIASQHVQRVATAERIALQGSGVSMVFVTMSHTCDRCLEHTHARFDVGVCAHFRTIAREIAPVRVQHAFNSRNSP